jgi:hypothetical protein
MFEDLLLSLEIFCLPLFFLIIHLFPIIFNSQKNIYILIRTVLVVLIVFPLLFDMFTLFWYWGGDGLVNLVLLPTAMIAFYLIYIKTIGKKIWAFRKQRGVNQTIGILTDIYIAAFLAVMFVEVADRLLGIPIH